MIVSGLLRGATAGAAGTTALNAFTYADMAARARPASTAPEQAVSAIADKIGHPVPGGAPRGKIGSLGSGRWQV